MINSISIDQLVNKLIESNRGCQTFLQRVGGAAGVPDEVSSSAASSGSQMDPDHLFVLRDSEETKNILAEVEQQLVECRTELDVAIREHRHVSALLRHLRCLNVIYEPISCNLLLHE